MPLLLRASFVLVLPATLLLASSAQAQGLSRSQTTCVTKLNKAVSKIAATRHRNALSCLKSASKGKLPPGQGAQQCVLADNKGKVEKARAKAQAIDTASCVPAPPAFGYAGADAASEAASAAAVDLFADIFGDDLGASAIAASTDAAGARCQAAAAQAALKVAAAMTGEFVACKTAGLEDGVITGNDGLEACLDAIAADGKGKVAKAAQGLEDALAETCGAMSPATAFPGTCSASANLAGCMRSAARCRVCQHANGADALERDCDLFDDGAANSSCVSTACVDDDHDGFGASCALGEDCNDSNAAVHPAAAELCNGVDDDCSGGADDFPVDVGAACGNDTVAPCSLGVTQCSGNALTCSGSAGPGVETCNGIDDDCDGVIDMASGQPPADSDGACNEPVPPPPGATSACTAGAKTCVDGVVRCLGAVGPTGTADTCGVDANCDGVLTGQPDVQSDAHNCGACGNVCGAANDHTRWTCVSGSCAFQGCQPGFYDLDGDQSCETPCTATSTQEQCNGIDDNCNGQIDENLVPPAPVQACGVSPAASAAECTTAVSIVCSNGTWTCTFPDDVCEGGCSNDDEICDELDNDCDGTLNENVAGYGRPCSSDDGHAVSHGPCRTTGTMVCNGADEVVCSAVKAPCAALPGGCTELCDGVDNDCDGGVDETFNFKGADPANYVRPAVTRIASSTWIYSYEASRPSATSVIAGTGNGYHTSAPAGSTLDKTPACSASNRQPWTGVTPMEVEQTCAAMGGSICSATTWQTAVAAQIPGSCTWGYSPRGTACTTSTTSNKYCNHAGDFDFSISAGLQVGVLPGGSSALQNCWADWAALLGNTTATNKIFDITGNVRELVRSATGVYRALGGSFGLDSENIAGRTALNPPLSSTYQLFDTGFRCCFTQDPTQ